MAIVAPDAQPPIKTSNSAAIRCKFIVPSQFAGALTSSKYCNTVVGKVLITVVKRDEHLAEWIRLTEKREAKASQVGTHKQKGQKSGGVNTAARELCIAKSAAHRAVQAATPP